MTQKLAKHLKVLARLILFLAAIPSLAAVPSKQGRLLIEATLNPHARVIHGTLKLHPPPGININRYEMILPTWSDLYRRRHAPLAGISATVSQNGAASSDISHGARPRMEVSVPSPGDEDRDQETSPLLSLSFVTSLESGGRSQQDLQQVRWLLAKWHPEFRDRATGALATFDITVNWHSPKNLCPLFAGTSTPRNTSASTPDTEKVCSNTFRANQVSAIHGIIAPGASKVIRTSDTGRPIIGIYDHPEFLSLFDTALQGLNYLERRIAPLGDNTMLLVATNDPWSPTLSGLIPIELPRQAVLRWLISKQSYWLHWRTLETLVSQWWGVQIGLTDARVSWIQEGFAAYYVLSMLSENAIQTKDLTGVPGGVFSFLSWTYLQHLSGFASVAARQSLDNALVNFTAEDALASSLAYVRLTLALRQASAYVGQEKMQQRLAALYTKLQGSAIHSGRTWLEHLKQEGSEGYAFVHQWVSYPGWWDPALASCYIENDTLHVSIEHRGEIWLPVSVAFRNQHVYVGNKHPIGKATFTLTPQTSEDVCSEVILDPQRYGFDRNRFNNTFTLPPLAVFPGSIQTVRDDGYTLAWMPFARRTSGNPWVVGIASAVLRYLDSASMAGIGYAGASNEWLAFARYQSASSLFGWSPVLYLERDLNDDQLIEWEFAHSGTGAFHDLSLTATVQGLVPRGNYDHWHFPLSLTLELSRLPSFSHKLKGSAALNATYTPRELSSGFAYHRFSGLLRLEYAPFYWFDITWRGFSGIFSGTGPDGVLFDPQDPDGAGLRVDFFNREALQRPKVRSMSLELRPAIPFIDPNGDGGVLLMSKTRLALFADYGVIENESNQARQILRDYGIGLRLPFGGDIAGWGTTVFTGVRMDLVTYAQVGDQVDRRPKLLFSFYQVH